MLRNRTVRLVLSVAVSVTFLWLAFRNVDLKRALDQLVTVAPWSVAVYVATQCIIQLTRFWRWDLLIKPFANLPWRDSFRISNVGILLILTLPLRLGEMARPILLKREAGVRMSSSLGAVAVERTLDGLTVTLLFFITTFTLPERYVVPGPILAGAWGSLALFSSAFVVIIGMLVAHDPVLRLIRLIGKPISERLTEKAIGMAEAFVEGLRAVPNVRSIVSLLGLTVVYWGANALGYYAVFRGFGWDFPPQAAILLVSIIVIAIMIPAGPAFLGTFQGAIVAGLAIFGANDTQAAAYGWVVYPITVIINLSFGLPYLFTGVTKISDAIGTETTSA